MELTKIYFDSFKSLIDEELELNANCIGIVGINESGKSNILEAIRVLREQDMLSQKHQPKITKSNPKLRFDFRFTDEERKEAIKIIDDWFGINTLLGSKSKLLEKLNFKIQLCFELKLENSELIREANIILDEDLPDDILALQEEFINEDKV